MANYAVFQMMRYEMNLKAEQVFTRVYLTKRGAIK